MFVFLATYFCVTNQKHSDTKQQLIVSHDFCVEGIQKWPSQDGLFLSHNVRDLIWEDSKVDGDSVTESWSYS